MRYLLILFSCLLSLTVFGQNLTIVGTCVDQRRNPIENVKIQIEGDTDVFYSDSLGKFEILSTQKEKVTIKFKDPIHNHTEKKFVNFEEGKDFFNLGKVKFPFVYEQGVDVNTTRIDEFELGKLNPRPYELVPAYQFEQNLKFNTVARSSNELTSNYNVQGGSYDENLVYVNGFLIYRPFLTRSGQQEGMSFINSALIESIQFSGGGFSAEYGDKLSSVLDITYKKPESRAAHGSLNASILGIESHIEQGVGSRFTYLAGARYRSNGYFLNSLPTKGAYNPVFYDAQILTNFAITERLTWSVIGHFSTNNFRFSPQTQRTDFGTANEAYSFTIYFEGQEQTRFQTMTGGTALEWKTPLTRKKQTKLGLYATIFQTDEREYFDVLGQYFINELETDPSKEEFGDSIAVLGVGSFLNHARNKLEATILNVYHRGEHDLKHGFSKNGLKHKSHKLKWGVNYQINEFEDVLSEWKMIDSAGYSVPQAPSDEIQLFETVKGELSLSTFRATSFIQLNSLWRNIEKDKVIRIVKKEKVNKEKIETVYIDTISSSISKWALSFGVRSGYTSSNQEYYITPRATLKFFPRSYLVKDSVIRRRALNYRLSTGLYYQPPFYREFRTFDGQLNMNVKSQKSFHVVAGSDFYFLMWDREAPFKLSTEAFYKYMWDVNPYEVDNVRTRYYATNDTKAYAYGIDFILNGEFVEGIQSFFKLGFLRTQEDLLNDYYYDYYNAAGDKIIFGISEDQNIADSARIEPGFIPRPTDQLMTASILIQDRMPTFESFSVQMGLNYGSSLPYGPPDFNKYKDTLRIRSYFRVDIGFSYDFLYKESTKKNFFRKNFSDAILSFEVFNLLGVNNVLSKQWIQDTQGKYYSIPNYLTQRRFNLKMILKF